MAGSDHKDGDGQAHAHIDAPEDHTATPPEGAVSSSPGMKNSKGWDGKLRVPKSALLSNPEALSDSEYSDEENVLEGENIAADEGKMTDHPRYVCASFSP